MEEFLYTFESFNFPISYLKQRLQHLSHGPSEISSQVLSDCSGFTIQQYGTRYIEFHIG